MVAVMGFVCLDGFGGGALGHGWVGRVSGLARGHCAYYGGFDMGAQKMSIKRVYSCASECALSMELRAF